VVQHPAGLRAAVKRWLGKLVGGLLGLALTRHPIGIAVGVALGHAWDSGLLDPLKPVPGRREGAFVVPLFELAGFVAKVDGRVSEAEVAEGERLLDRLQLTGRKRREAVNAFSRGREGRIDPEACARALRAFAGFSGDFKAVLLDVLAGIGCADGALDARARRLIELTAQALDFDAAVLEQILARRRGGGAQGHAVEDPYAMLGVARDADDEAVRAAYRRLIAQHHPDRLGDADAATRAAAEAEAARINAAWEQVRARRGLK
jgi:DnaJ like chaperone protein